MKEYCTITVVIILFFFLNFWKVNEKIHSVPLNQRFCSWIYSQLDTLSGYSKYILQLTNIKFTKFYCSTSSHTLTHHTPLPPPLESGFKGMKLNIENEWIWNKQGNEWFIKLWTKRTNEYWQKTKTFMLTNRLKQNQWT